MLFAEALETAKCFEEGVISSSAAANIGSIMGIGFPPNTGGAAQFMTGYEAGRRPRSGSQAFLARADELAEAYGERFRPTAYLRDLAAKGEALPGLSLSSRPTGAKRTLPSGSGDAGTRCRGCADGGSGTTGSPGRGRCAPGCSRVSVVELAPRERALAPVGAARPVSARPPGAAAR